MSDTGSVVSGANQCSQFLNLDGQYWTMTQEHIVTVGELMALARVSSIKSSFSR